MPLSLLSFALWRGIGRLWRGMGGGRPPRRQHGRLGFHQPRDTQYGFSPVPPAIPRRATPSPANGFFTNHETRNTNHGLYAFLPTFSHDFPAFPTISRPPPPPWERVRRAVRSLLSCALWRGIGRLWRGMGGGRPPRRQHGRLGFHQPRDTQHGFSLSLRRLQGEQPQARPTGFSRITRHETRITAFMPLSLLSFALWCGIGRLWRGMGGRRPPRRQHGLLGFHQPRITQHVFPLSSGDSKESNPKPGQRVFHESRNTKHESRPLCLSSPRFPTISRHFPLFFGTPPPPGADVRAPSAAKLPPPTGDLLTRAAKPRGHDFTLP